MMQNMKRKNNWVRAAMLLLLTMLTTTTVWADDFNVVVWFNDGTKTGVEFTEKPTFTYADGHVTLTTTKGSVTWPLTQLRKLTFKDETKQTIVVNTEDGESIEVNVEVQTNDEDGEKTAIVTAVSASDSEQDNSVVAIPSEMNLYGDTYTVTEIADNLFAGMTEVTDIYLPTTEEPVKIGIDALKIDDNNIATVHSPLALLDDYSLNDQLKQHVDAGKLTATIKAPNKYWTFSCGINVVIPDNIKVYKCVIEGDKVKITMIDEELLLIKNKRTILANNGVLVACPDDDMVNAYDIVANPGVNAFIDAEKDAKSYGENWLEPVIKSKNYAAGDYYVLKDNEFHAIIDNNSKVPDCKAVLKKPAGVAASRTLWIEGGDDDATGISTFSPISADNESVWYNLNGQRISKPSAKGVYIRDGKIIIIK